MADEKSKDDFIYVPQMELEVLEYSGSPYAGSSSTSTHESNIEGGNLTRSNHPNGSFPFKKMARCDICSKYFNKHYLEAHRRSHSGEKPFKVSVFIFKTSKCNFYLPFKCSVSGCNRTFTQSSSRNFHEKRFHRPDAKFIKSESSFNGDCEEILQHSSHQQHFQEHHMLMLNSDPSEFEMHTDNQLLDNHQQQQLHHQQESQSPQASSNQQGKTNKTIRLSKGNINILKHICLHCGKCW